MTGDFTGGRMVGPGMFDVTDFVERQKNSERPPPGGGLRLVDAKVSAVNRATGTVDLTHMNGAAAATAAAVPRWTSYMPTVGDDVHLLHIPGGRHFVVGKIATVETVAAKARRSTTQSIPWAALTAVQFNVEDFDPLGNMIDLVANNTRVTSRQAGAYLICGMSGWSTNDTGRRVLDIRKNGSGTARRMESPVRPSVENGTHAAWLLDTLVVPGDYYELIVYHDISGGGALNTSGTGGLHPELFVMRLS